MYEFMESLIITELKNTIPSNPGEYAVCGQISASTRKQTRNGNPYYEVELCDSTGSIKLKAWQDSVAFSQAESLKGSEWVRIEGHWSSNEYGLDARDWQLSTLGAEEIADVLAGTEETKLKQKEDYNYIQSVCETLSDPRFRSICTKFLERFGDRFKRSAGARNLHHARRGGLTEHVAQMIRSAEGICSAYTNLNRDLLISGILFHDCGKMWENTFPKDGFTMPYDFRAELTGHIAIGAEIVNSLWRETESEVGGEWKLMESSSEKARIHLVHLILSHHGKIEYGSPILPKTPEAIILHHIDNIDAKIEMIYQGYEEQEPLSQEVLSKVWALETNIVRPLEKYCASSDQTELNDN